MKSSNRIKLAIVAMTVCLTGVASAQSVCVSKGCTEDEFLFEKMWAAREYSESDGLTEFEAGSLRSCLSLTVLRVQERFFQERNKLTPAQFKSQVMAFDDASLARLYSGCKSNFSRDQFAQTLAKILGTQREKTKFSAIIASPDAYTTKTVRVDGVGMYAMNKLTLSSSPTDMNPIVIEVDSQTAEEREKLVSQCGNVKSRCKLTIWGKVKTTAPLITISTKDEMIEFRK